MTLDPDTKRFMYADEKALVSRVHTQIIHTYTGWPLRHFKDLNELLRIISDIIKGKRFSSRWLGFSDENSQEHKHLYYNGRVLHRDISIENIIIVTRGDETKGRLIDLDHAKVVNSSTARMAREVSAEQIQDLRGSLGEDYLIADEVVEKFLKYFAGIRKQEAATYILDAVEFRAQQFGLETDREVKLADIGWHHQVGFK